MKVSVPLILAFAASFIPAPPANPQQTGERIRRVVVFGNDPCPRGSGDEIVVCARRPENERYRIPEELRDEQMADDPESEAWAARAQSLEFVGRTGIQSCSTVGPGGFTGCWEELMRQARAERSSNPENRPQDR